MDLFDSPPLQQPKSTARAEGRSLPFSEDGEKGVLCSLLLSPRDVLDLCQIKLRPEAFYSPAHQILFNLVAELVDFFQKHCLPARAEAKTHSEMIA